MSDWSWMLQLLCIVVYGLINHTLLSLVTKFIYSKPPGQRMVRNKPNALFKKLQHNKTKFGKLKGVEKTKGGEEGFEIGKCGSLGIFFVKLQSQA